MFFATGDTACHILILSKNYITRYTEKLSCATKSVDEKFNRNWLAPDCRDYWMKSLVHTVY